MHTCACLFTRSSSGASPARGACSGGRVPHKSRQLGMVHTCGQLCGYVSARYCHRPFGGIFPRRLWITRGQPVERGPHRWGRARRGCGRPVGDETPSTAGTSLSAGRSTRHTHPDRCADLRRCDFSTVSTPPKTMTTSIYQGVPPRVPIQPRPARTTPENHRSSDSGIRVGRPHHEH